MFHVEQYNNKKSFKMFHVEQKKLKFGKRFRKIHDFEKEIFISSQVFFENGLIIDIKEKQGGEFLLLPGFIESHVHVESSMLIPSRFSELAVCRGVIAVLTDPQEVANVMGIDGFDFMLKDSENADLKIFFGVPSCVPATSFETSGFVFDEKIIENLIKDDKVVVLSEMMNFPGVINNVSDVIEKLNVAKKYNKPIDGHAPGLRGNDLDKYIASGISTDHKAYTFE